MKIPRLNESLPYLSLVRPKEDGESPHQEQRQDQQPGKDEPFEHVLEATEEKVDQAIQSFQKEAQAQTHGLTVNLEGKGPGMKVVLKDGTGALVRQFTGEEFLKLREAAATGRGKLLDRKL